MREPKADSCLFVMFGATGDLMRRKLLPALFHLMEEKQLPESCRILGVARSGKLSDTRFREWACKALASTGLPVGRKARGWCENCLHYQSIGAECTADYQTLAARIAQIERAHALPGNRVMYLALPPGAFFGTIEALGKAGLCRSQGWTRVVIEKPFGYDFASARRLNALVHEYFNEAQVYRIDHYLGKETVQNLLAFRFGNALFESVWNRDHIESVEITVAEKLGIGRRSAYYEQTGALRDMVQNHLTQLLTLIAMEVPAALEADSIRFEKVKVLRAVAPIRGAAVVYGQYAGGRANGRKLPAYRDEPGVSPRSRRETFVAMRLEIENWRWQGVPFYMRTGKNLSRLATHIAINFRRPPVAMFRALDHCTPHTNVLLITLQPDEGFDLSFEVKSPGERFTLQTQRMDFRYAEAFGPLSAGYDTLLREVVRGDQTSFVHADETEASWRLYSPLLRNPPRLHYYPAGSPGPAKIDELLRFPNCTWTTL